MKFSHDTIPTFPCPAGSNFSFHDKVGHKKAAADIIVFLSDSDKTIFLIAFYRIAVLPVDIEPETAEAG